MKGSMTVSEAGRLGGVATRKRHGPEFYEMIGRKGGQTTRAKHGHAYFVRIGRIGGAKLAKLVALGKAALKEAGEVTA